MGNLKAGSFGNGEILEMRRNGISEEEESWRNGSGDFCGRGMVE